MILYAALIAFVVSLAATGALIGPLTRRGAIDVPNERSSHERPTPRGGGLGLLAGLLAGGATAAVTGPTGIDPVLPLALLLVCGAGLADDLLGGVSRWGRLAAQAIAATLVVARLGGLERLPFPAPADLPLGPLGAVAAVLWILVMVNLTNFLDGIDGLAAGQGALAGLGLAAAGWLRGDEGVLVLVGLLLAAACLGFLRWNRPPARIFLGDVGSAAIGLLLAVAPWTLPSGRRPEGVLLVALLASYFVVDGSCTLVGRMVRGEAFWRPHRSHVYQRLVRSGLDHGATVVLTLGSAVPAATLAVIGYGRGSAALEWTAIGAAVTAYALVRLLTLARERSR